jgi:TonB family protein
LRPAQGLANIPSIDWCFGWSKPSSPVTDGTALVEFALTSSGEVNDIETVRMSHPIFSVAAVAAVKRLKCSAKTDRVRVRMPFAFHIEN